MDHMHGMGMWVPSVPPTWARLFRVHLDGWSVLAVLSVVALLAYLAGVVRAGWDSGAVSQRLSATSVAGAERIRTTAATHRRRGP